MLQATERRKVLPAPNLSNCQKGKGHCPEHDPECRREQENHSLRPQNTPANSTTTQRPTTATHSANKKHHQYKTPPASTVTPRLSEKSASQSAIGLLGHSGRGRTNRRGTFRTGSPTGTKKEVPTECYFNRDFRKAAAAYSPTWWGSTIGASELNFSVRYGKRWILTAITTAVYYLREITKYSVWLLKRSRAISTGRLKPLLALHLLPINVVVSHDP